MSSRIDDVTRILTAIEDGDPQAASELLPLVYEELRTLAAQRLAQEIPGQTLQATALVHEAYIRLVGKEQEWDNSGHFFAAAAEAMRRILIENARRKQSVKHGGDRKKVGFQDGIQISADIPTEDILTLNDALEKLARNDEESAEFVKLRFFAGLTNQQAAKVLGISKKMVDKYWAYARSWLRVEMSRGE